MICQKIKKNLVIVINDILLPRIIEFFSLPFLILKDFYSF